MTKKSKYNPAINKKDSRIFLSHQLLQWYNKHRRDLPWRIPLGTSPDMLPPAYHVFLSEAMLQQTQVATVIPYFHRFLAAFPTIQHLAQADEQDVLKLWQGLGYYSRARNLRLAAIRIVDEHAGVIPSDLLSLQKLPGVGRYTSGAISSIAYNERSPILDGNVIRVLSRYDGIRGDPRDKTIQLKLWERAEEILPNKRTGDFNSALMELGAMICTPKSPKCESCPIQRGCVAFKENLQAEIPPPKKSTKLKVEERWVFCIRNKKGSYLMQQRPPTGRWAGMWQFYTLETDEPPFEISNLKLSTKLNHTLTHRKYQFEVYRGDLKGKPPVIANAKWLSIDDCHKLPLPKPHAMVLNQIINHQDTKKTKSK